MKNTGKRIFGWAFLGVLVSLLAACSSNVVPNQGQGVVLELQIITSQPDSSAIDHLEIRDAYGNLVFAEENLVNRIHRFNLSMGETYTVSAEISFTSDTAPKSGKTTYERRVAMIASEQRMVLDLRDQLGVWEDPRGSSNEELEVGLGFPSELYGMELVTGVFTTAASRLLKVERLNPFLDEGVWYATEKPIEGKSVLTFGLYEVRDPTLNYHHFTLSFEDGDWCTYQFSVPIGTFEFLWENENSRMNQTVYLYKGCKG